MIKQASLALLAAVTMATTALAGSSDTCTTTLRVDNERLSIEWIPMASSDVKNCQQFSQIEPGYTVEGPCEQQYVRCKGDHGGKPHKCEVRSVVSMKVVEVERERVVRKKEVVREHGYTSRRRVTRHSGGRWEYFPHRDSMSVFPRGSIPTNQKRCTSYGGATLCCWGGSLTTGQHRSCKIRR